LTLRERFKSGAPARDDHALLGPALSHSARKTFVEWNRSFDRVPVQPQCPYPIAHVPFEHEVGAQHLNCGIRQLALNLETRIAQSRTQGLDLITAGNRACVVVTKHKHCPFPQAGTQHAQTTRRSCWHPPARAWPLFHKMPDRENQTLPMISCCPALKKMS
jgi:hypothetical protein